MTEYRTNEIKRKIDSFPLLAVKNGVVISSAVPGDPGHRDIPHSGRWAAEFFSAAASVTFSEKARKSGLLPLYRGGEFREEVMFFDTFRDSTDGMPIKILSGEDPVPRGKDNEELEDLLSERISGWITDILPEREKNRYLSRYGVIGGCFKPSCSERKKSFSSPSFLVGALNKTYRKRFSTESTAVSIEAFSPEAKRAELFLPASTLCAMVFLTTALITRCISPDPMSPEIKSRFILYESKAILSFSAPAKDIGYFSVSSANPLDAIKIFPGFSGELTGLYRLCVNTDCEFSLSVSDSSATVSYTFPSYMKRQRLRSWRESEAELEFYDILADFIL